MFNWQQRGHTILANAVSTLFSILFVVGFLTPYYNSHAPLSAKHQPMVEVQASQLRYGRHDPMHFSHEAKEYGQLRFTLNGDLSSLFGWNAKQLFVYVLLEYPSATATHNQIVIWDSIVRNPRDAVFSANREYSNKYGISDYRGSSLKGRNGTLSVHWEVGPWFGRTLQGVGPHTATIRFPDRLS